MNRKTIEYYNSNTEDFIRRTVNSEMSGCQKKFLGLLKSGSRVLDAGCGSGRDSKFFLEQGLRVDAIDASEKMCQAASEYIGQPVNCISFEELEARERYDGIWACASLLHVGKGELPLILKKFYDALKEDGILYASFKYGTDEQWRLGRFFSDYQLEELERIFLRDGLFELVEAFETEDERQDYKNKPWINVIVKKRRLRTVPFQELPSYPAVSRLLLVDGSNLLFQMFFGMPARIVNEQGKAIQGTMGFVGALLKIIRRILPTHIIVLFDGQQENKRTALDAGYKANRVDYGEKPVEENPFSQLPDVYAALDYLGIRHTEAAACEADDLIAGYARTYGQENEIVISSFDSDFFQLITEKVSVLRYRGEGTVVCTPDYIHQKFGILPVQYADFKSMTGDASDNIRGADKIGPKTAALLLNEFGTLEGILANAAAIRKPSIRESVIRNTDRLRVNRRLICLDGLEPLPYVLDELIYELPDITTNGVLRGIGLKE